MSRLPSSPILIAKLKAWLRQIISITAGHHLSRLALAVSLAVLTSPIISLFLSAQTSPTQAPAQQPRTAPQIQQVLPSYEGQKVTTIELAGQPGLDAARFMPLLRQKAGAPFSRAQVDASIAALKQSGKFDTVQLQVLPEMNGIRVLFVLEPAYYVGMYDFPGSGRFSYSRLLQVANYPPRGPYSQYGVDLARKALETFFHGSGYFRAKVTPRTEVDPQHKLVNVYFETDLGRRAKFGDIDIEGTTPEETAHYRDVLHSFMARLRGAAIRPGKTYKSGTLQKATNYLENELTKNDHLAAKVRLIGANYDPETNRADVKFHVVPGPIVRVKVEGARLWPWKRRSLLPVYQQVGVDTELIQEGRQNLISYFQSKGYFDTKIDTQVQQQGSGETILYRITKGPRHEVESVAITGSQHISEDRLMPHVAVEKAHFLSHGKFSKALIRKSVTNLENIYKAEGYSSVKVTPLVKDRDGDLAVTFQVDEGQQDVVDALRIVGNDTLPESQFAPNGLKVTAGQPYSQKRVDEDRSHIIAAYLNRGYLNATIRERLQKVGDDPHRLEVVYEINEGPQVRTAQIITVGRKHTQQKLINREIATLKPRQPLQERAMLESSSQLYTPGIFDWAQVDPRRQVTTQSREDVVVKVHEDKRNSITYGFGFEVINRGGSVPSGTVALPGLPPVGLPNSFKTSQKTFYGPRGTVEYTRKNLRGKAESLSFTGLAGRLDQRGSAIYTNPSFMWSSWKTSLSVTGEHNSENPIFTSRQGQVGYQFERPLDAEGAKHFSVRYSFTETGLTRLLIPQLVPAADQHVRLSTISNTYTRDTRDNLLDAHKGIYQSYQIDLNPSVLGSNVDFARLLAQTAYYKKIAANIVWANSLRIGLEQPFAGSHVPISEQFFSGGGSTLRGFPLNGAGPQNTIPACGTPGDPSTCSLITVPAGGNQLLIINSELRIPIPYDFPILGKKLGVAAFYDGGNVYRTIGFHDFWANYTNSVGGGLRYETPVGPIRIDIGHNLNALPGIKSTQIFITLGQAF
jgi:outer membrane protein insertion porin family